MVEVVEETKGISHGDDAPAADNAKIERVGEAGTEKELDDDENVSKYTWLRIEEAISAKPPRYSLSHVLHGRRAYSLMVG